MAIRTQIRLPQITGSFGDAQGKIVDNLPVAATLAAIPDGSGSMVSAMSQLASSIQRIHGGAAFTTNAAGVFSQDLTITDDNKLQFRDTDVHISSDADGYLSAQADTGVNINVNGTDEIAVTATESTFGGNIAIPDNGTIGSAGAASAITIANDGIVTFNDDIKLKDEGTIGNASVAEMIKLLAGGNVKIENDLTVAGGDIQYTNANNATLSIGATEHNAAGKALTITAGSTTAGTTNNIAGGSLTIQGGQGKGNAAGGDIIFQTANAAGSDGSDMNAYATALTLSDDLSATFAGAVTIAGNLDINGTTTTIDTTNLSVEDSIIALGVSGSDGSYTNAGQRGILFPIAPNSYDKVAGFYYDNERFKLAKTATGPTSGSFAPVTQGDHLVLQLGDLEFHGSSDHIKVPGGGALTMTGDNGVELVSSNSEDIVLDSSGAVVIDGSGVKLEFGDADGGEHISGDTDNLTIAAGTDINLTATDDVNIPSGVGLTFGNDGEKIEGDGAKLVISAANLDLTMEAGGDVTLPNDIGLVFGDSGEKIEGDGTDLTIASSNLLNLNADTGVVLTSGYLSLGDGANAAGELRFLEDTNDGSFYAAFKAGDVTATYTMLLPQALGTANQILALDNDSGQLIFQNPNATARKHVAVLDSAVAAGTVVSDGISSGNHAAGFDLRSISVDSMPARLDVFVNGQLLQSSSNAFGSLAPESPGDYSVAGSEENTGVKFTFDLEIDDTVSVIIR